MHPNVDSLRIVALPFIGLTLTLGACASQKAAESDPDDASVEEHQRAAEQEEQKAEKHREQYDEDATRQEPSGLATADPTQRQRYSTEIYNPTEYHLEEAEQHERYASQHEKAAEALLAFEEKHCEQFPEEVRASCPLMGQVESVEDVEKGAKLQIVDSVNLDAITDHMRCHFAFGRTQDHEGMQSCPLYLEELSFEKVEDDHAVIIRTDKKSNLQKVRERSRAHVG